MADAYPLQRLFFDLSESDVREIQDKAVAIIKEGKTLMNVSAGGKSGGKQFPMPPDRVLFECRAALKHINPITYGRNRRFTVSRVRCTGYGF